MTPMPAPASRTRTNRTRIQAATLQSPLAGQPACADTLAQAFHLVQQHVEAELECLVETSGAEIGSSSHDAGKILRQPLVAYGRHRRGSLGIAGGFVEDRARQVVTRDAEQSGAEFRAETAGLEQADNAIQHGKT